MTVDDFGDISRSLDCVINFLKNGAWYDKSYYRLLIGNHTLAFDWCHFWWPWSTFEGHFSLGCHFHIHFSNLWPAFASRGLPAIAELLVSMAYRFFWIDCKSTCNILNCRCIRKVSINIMILHACTWGRWLQAVADPAMGGPGGRLPAPPLTKTSGWSWRRDSDTGANFHLNP